MAVFNNILAGASGATGAAGFKIERSLRFNKADSAYLNRTPSSAGNRKTWTWSGWVKRANSDSDHHLFVGDKAPSDSLSDTTFGRFYILSTGQLDLSGYTTAYRRTNALLRDPSAWYHLVVAVDTTQSTADDRIKLYINGSQVSNTDFATKNNPSLNADLAFNQATPHTIGARSRSGTIAHYHDGYLAEIHFVDGQALAATDFGEYDDNNNWNPKAYSGTYGTNGFHLDFSDNSSNAALGYDAAGSNDWDVTNITASATKWSSYLIPQSPATFDSSYPASEAFDGSIAANQEARLNAGAYADRYIDFIPTGGIAFSSQIEMYVGVSDFEYSYNGGSNVAVTAGAWHTVASGGGTLTSIRIQRTQTLTHTWRALRVDGTILVDGDPAGTDSLIDTPTNYEADSGNNGGNYCTMNPLAKGPNCTLSNGNLDITTQADPAKCLSTIGMSSGKWYSEFTCTNNSPNPGLGTLQTNLNSGFLGNDAYGWVYGANGKKYHNDPGATGATYGASYTTGDVIGVAFDADAGTLTFYKNGTSQGAAYTGLTSGPYFFATGGSYSSSVANFGQRPFAYTPPTGYVSLCTTNLPDPTIADGSTAFDVDAYTGNGSTQERSEFSFEPDLVWIKARSAGYNHYLVDQVRGFNGSNARVLQPNLTNAEESADGPGDAFASFDDDGFTVKLGTGNWSGTNQNNVTYVAWAWDAGTSTVSNTDGSITSSVRANPSAGFSIVKYTGVGAARTIGHGLNAAPEMIITKARNQATYDWAVYHSAIGATKHLRLNKTTAEETSSYAWNDTAPTSSVFSVANASFSGDPWNYVAYCFAPVEGYSAFGSYEATGSAPIFVHTGFSPAWVIIKDVDASGTNWLIFDNKRDPYNLASTFIRANESGVEIDNQTANGSIDFLSNGFAVRASGTSNLNTTINVPNSTVIWAAFAENPFKTARAR